MLVSGEASSANAETIIRVKITEAVIRRRVIFMKRGDKCVTGIAGDFSNISGSLANGFRLAWNIFVELPNAIRARTPRVPSITKAKYVRPQESQRSKLFAEED